MEIRPQYAIDEVAEASDDTVVIEARHVIESGADALFGQFDARAALGRLRIASGEEQFDQQLGNVWIARKRALHVILAELDTCLLQIFRNRPQHGHLPPRQPGADDQAIETVALARTADNRVKRFFQRPLDHIEIEGPTIGPFRQTIQYRRLAHTLPLGGPGDRITVFGDDAETEIFETRKRNEKGQGAT